MIWSISGPPYAGKSVLAIGLAEVLQKKTTSVLVVFPSLEAPALPYLFPAIPFGSLVSLGEAFSEAEISDEMILKAAVTRKNKPNVGYLGFKAGETAKSYPPIPEEKAGIFLEKAARLAEHVLVIGRDSVPGKMAFMRADRKLVVFRSELKSLSFGRGDLISDAKTFFVLNHASERDEPDAGTQKAFFPDRRPFVLPYSRAIAQASGCGELTLVKPEKRWMTAIEAIAGEAGK